MRHRLGTLLARYLARPRAGHSSLPATTPEDLGAVLQAGDVLRVEGTSRLSTAIKYLTQSTWSHAALYAGDRLGGTAMLVEADVVEGVRLVPLSLYSDMHTRICRPVGLGPAELDALLGFLRARLGNGYDLRNVFDLLRYLVRVPVPEPMKRRMLALGSGDPTRAICSTLLAQAFESIRYPILPLVESIPPEHPGAARARREILHIRDWSLFVPRDFDVSPYFRIVKPRLDDGFDYRTLRWGD
ncbi:MAG: lipo-like protein [Gammaproteobacteria bacterium]|nr:lipo-like protein [Gammaproteobacteria bacterium]